MGYLRSSPRASPKTNSPTLQYLFDVDSKSNGGSTPSSPLKGKQSSVDLSENEEILSTILFCRSIFTFVDPSECPTQQNLKRIKLSQLLCFIRSAKKSMNDQILSALFSMLSVNIIRPLPPPCNPLVIYELPDEEELVSAPTLVWPHLQIVYDILLRLVLNVDPKILSNYIDNKFLRNLIPLFQSEDPRERESLKNIYHRIYSKFTFHRSFMRKAMNDVFLHYISETERHCGIGDMLEIWGSIINGFAVPLKEEHKLFLMRVLIPLHKTKGMQVYHRQLSYCVNQFVQKEPMLGGLVVRGILRYWPVTNCQKEVMLVGELEELMENLDPDQYRKLALPLCSQITRCLSSWNSQVAERGLYIWNNEQFVKIALSAMDEVFPVVVEGIERNLKLHWSKSVKQLTENVKSMLQEMDPIMYSKCVTEIDRRKIEIGREEMKRNKRWEIIELVANAVSASDISGEKNQVLRLPNCCVFVSH